MGDTEEMSRREFVRTAAAGASVAGAPYFVSASALGKEGKPPPSDRIQLGLIGCGGMGTKNLDNCSQYDDVVVTAACDVWKKRRDRVAEKYGESCRTYKDYRKVLNRDDVDAVIIATPAHWHALQVIDACEAGKDVYHQKPMTIHLGESLAVRNAVEKHEVVSQVGTQIHAGSNYRRVVEYVRSGKLGDIGAARTFHIMNQGVDGVGHAGGHKTPEKLGLDWDLYCGPAPKKKFNPLIASRSGIRCSWMEYSGGWTPGMAPHIIDLPVWALELQYPTEVSSSGGRYVVQDDGNAYDQHEVLWQYPDMTLTWMTSLTNSYGFDFNREKVQGEFGGRTLGIYFHGVNATLYSDYGDYTVVPEGDRLEDTSPPPKSIPASPGQEREWLNCIKTREQPSCSAQYHVRVDVPIALSLLSYRLGRSISFDPEKEGIVGDREAARKAVPEYRDPWTFPTKYL